MSAPLTLHLVDLDHALVAAWRVHFAAFPEVDICHDDILDIASHCVVSPSNSHGYMDGGVDRAYSRFFGAAIEGAVLDLIARRPEGHLPVGAADYVETGHPRVPYLILAPTMVMPEHVPALNAQRALGAVIRLVRNHRPLAADVFCPGLGSGVGAIPADDCARAMAAAYGARYG